MSICNRKWPENIKTVITQMYYPLQFHFLRLLHDIFQINIKRYNIKLHSVQHIKKTWYVE